MNRKVKLALKIFLSVILCLVIITVGVFGAVLMGWVDLTSDLNVEDIQLDFTSFVYYTDPDTGEEVEYERLYDQENRVWVDYADIPQHVLDAAVSIEDERFYSHRGFDIKSTSKAVYQYVFKRSTSRGASTITQQLVKNLTGEDEKTPIRKIQEILRAISLEQKLTKDQILELYLNTIFLGNQCNGLGSAADFYFDKDVSDLTVAEGAALVGITQYPSLYDPLVNPDKNKEKQELVLMKMLELGKIDQATYDEAIAEELVFTGKEKREASSRQSYFVDEVVRDVLKDLQEKEGYTEAVANKTLFSGGLKIYATVDPEVQQVLDEVYQDDSNFLKAPGEKQPESCMTIIEPSTGYIRGLVGGRGEKTANRTLNRATQSLRQPGSTIKPISVYAPAIEQNIITPNTVYTDKALHYGSWSPVNYYRGFRGSMTVRYAVEQSTNTVPIQILEDLGIEASYHFMVDNLHVTTLEESDKSLASLALGGLTYGMTNKELTAAYATFVNRGIYNPPVTYTKVLDHSGNVLLENKPEPTVAMSEKTAGTMLGLLKSVVDRGTGTPARFSGNYGIAGKTGTTDDDKDRWFVGMTPYYVGAVWYGFDEPAPMNFIVSNPTIPVWKKVMSEIHSEKELKAKAFDNIVYPTGVGTGGRKSNSSGTKKNNYSNSSNRNDDTTNNNNASSSNPPAATGSRPPSDSPTATDNQGNQSTGDNHENQGSQGGQGNQSNQGSQNEQGNQGSQVTPPPLQDIPSGLAD